MLEVIEVDPQSGNVISRNLSDIPITAAHSTAYDGRQLIVVDMLYQVAIDGTLIDQTPLPTFGDASSPIYVYGPVVVDGTISMLANNGAPTSLLTFDVDTKTFSNPKPITRMYIPEASSGQFSLTLSESADGKSIIAFDRYSGVYTIDPATGRMTQAIDRRWEESLVRSLKMLMVTVWRRVLIYRRSARKSLSTRTATEFLTMVKRLR